MEFQNGSRKMLMLQYVLLGFKEKEQFHQQTENIDTLCQPSVAKAYCVTGTEKNPEVRISCDFEHGRFSQAYGEIASCS